VKAKAIGTKEEGGTLGEGNGTLYDPGVSSKVLVVEAEPPAGDEEGETGVRGEGDKAAVATAVDVRESSEDSSGTVVSAVGTEGEGGKPRDGGGAPQERGAVGRSAVRGATYWAAAAVANGRLGVTTGKRRGDYWARGR